jgi:hypothetical protein
MEKAQGFSPIEVNETSDVRCQEKQLRYRMSPEEYRSIKDELDRLTSRIGKGEAETEEYKKKAEYLRSNAQAYRLDELFSYHAPTKDQQSKYESIRMAAQNFAVTVLALTPDGADQSEALRLIRTAVMTANAAIALNGLT